MNNAADFDLFDIMDDTTNAVPVSGPIAFLPLEAYVVRVTVAHLKTPLWRIEGRGILSQNGIDFTTRKAAQNTIDHLIACKEAAAHGRAFGAR